MGSGGLSVSPITVSKRIRASRAIKVASAHPSFLSSSSSLNTHVRLKRGVWYCGSFGLCSAVIHQLRQSGARDLVAASSDHEAAPSDGREHSGYPHRVSSSLALGAPDCPIEFCRSLVFTCFACGAAFKPKAPCCCAYRFVSWVCLERLPCIPR